GLHLVRVRRRGAVPALAGDPPAAAAPAREPTGGRDRAAAQRPPGRGAGPVGVADLPGRAARALGPQPRPERPARRAPRLARRSPLRPSAPRRPPPGGQPPPRTQAGDGSAPGRVTARAQRTISRCPASTRR